MDFILFMGLLVSFLPFFELRGGLPLILDYALRNDLPIAFFFLLSVAVNILAIFFVFFIFDFLHFKLIKYSFYKKVFEKYVKKIRKKTLKIKNGEDISFIALMLLVAVPLPGTGAWTGSFIAWLLDLNRLKSFFAISVGVIIAGLIILGLFLGLISPFY